MEKNLMNEIGAMELNDEMLDDIAGGAYTQSEWESMTVAERRAAQLRSIEARQKSEPCELD